MRSPPTAGPGRIRPVVGSTSTAPSRAWRRRRRPQSLTGRSVRPHQVTHQGRMLLRLRRHRRVGNCWSLDWRPVRRTPAPKRRRAGSSNGLVDLGEHRRSTTPTADPPPVTRPAKTPKAGLGHWSRPTSTPTPQAIGSVGCCATSRKTSALNAGTPPPAVVVRRIRPTALPAARGRGGDQRRRTGLSRRGREGHQHRLPMWRGRDHQRQRRWQRQVPARTRRAATWRSCRARRRSRQGRYQHVIEAQERLQGIAASIRTVQAVEGKDLTDHTPPATTSRNSRRSTRSPAGRTGPEPPTENDGAEPGPDLQPPRTHLDRALRPRRWWWFPRRSVRSQPPPPVSAPVGRDGQGRRQARRAVIHHGVAMRDVGPRPDDR